LTKANKSPERGRHLRDRFSYLYLLNIVSNNSASVSGGLDNEASGFEASVSGGKGNIASGNISSILGGKGNALSGEFGEEY
jgi:hypothetical protein